MSPDPQALVTRAGAGSSRRFGIVGGMHAVLQGAAFIVRHRTARACGVVPVLSFFVITGVLAYLSASTLSSWIREHLPAATTWSSLGAQALQLVTTVLAVIVSAFVGVVLAPVASAPALEKIVELQESELGASPRRGLGVWREFVVGFQAQVVALAVTAPLFMLLWCATLLLPGAVLFTLPLKALLLVATVAWNLIDYPLTLRGLGNRERIRWMRREWRAVLGYGTGVALTFAIPCGALLALPAAVAGATRLVVLLGTDAPSRMPAER